MKINGQGDFHQDIEHAATMGGTSAILNKYVKIIATVTQTALRKT